MPVCLCFRLHYYGVPRHSRRNSFEWAMVNQLVEKPKRKRSGQRYYSQIFWAKELHK